MLAPKKHTRRTSAFLAQTTRRAGLLAQKDTGAVTIRHRRSALLLLAARWVCFGKGNSSGVILRDLSRRPVLESFRDFREAKDLSALAGETLRCVQRDRRVMLNGVKHLVGDLSNRNGYNLIDALLFRSEQATIDYYERETL
jgi:hypothetical protein